MRQFIQNNNTALVFAGDLSGGVEEDKHFSMAYHDHVAFLIEWAGVLDGKVSISQAKSVDGTDAEAVEGLRRVYLAAVDTDLFHPIENDGFGGAMLAARPEAGPPPGPVGPTDTYTPDVPFLPPLVSVPDLGSFPSATEYQLPTFDSGRLVVEIDAEQLKTNLGFTAVTLRIETTGGGTNTGCVTAVFIRPRYAGNPHAAIRSVYVDPEV